MERYALLNIRNITMILFGYWILLLPLHKIYCSLLIMAEKKTYCIKTETLARFAKALGHPARIAIMKFLAKQKTCYFGDIHEELPIAQATVSQHLKELKDAGLIQGEIETPKVKYCIVRENWEYAKELFAELFQTEICKDKDCCQQD